MKTQPEVIISHTANITNDRLTEKKKKLGRVY